MASGLRNATAHGIAWHSMAMTATMTISCSSKVRRLVRPVSVATTPVELESSWPPAHRRCNTKNSVKTPTPKSYPKKPSSLKPL